MGGSKLPKTLSIDERAESELEVLRRNTRDAIMGRSSEESGAPGAGGNRDGAPTIYDIMTLQLN